MINFNQRFSIYVVKEEIKGEDWSPTFHVLVPKTQWALTLSPL